MTTISVNRTDQHLVRIWIHQDGQAQPFIDLEPDKVDELIRGLVRHRDEVRAAAAAARTVYRSASEPHREAGPAYAGMNPAGNAGWDGSTGGGGHGDLGGGGGGGGHGL